MDAAESEVYYDFLYKDTNRILSLYAQIYGGILASKEVTKGSKDASEKTASANISLLKGDWKSVLESNLSQKESFSPGDIMTVEVIRSLLSNGYVDGSYKAAANGKIVRAKGTICFADGTAISILSKALPHVHKFENKQIEKAAMAVLGNATVSSMYYLECGDSDYVSGIIKESGLDESISSFTSKYGPDGLGDIEVIGIKEVAKPVKPENYAQARKLIVDYYKIWNQFLMPPKAIMITPIVIYRKIKKTNIL